MDGDDPVSPAGPPRGYGGVAIFYRNDWDLKVVECPIGGNRVCAVEVQCDPPLLVVSTYLPSRKYVTKNSTSADPFEYETVLAKLSEIISIYQFSHEIIICGDMNASLQQRLGNKQDQALISFVRSLDLKSYQSGKPTFFHENGRDTSEIDYIFTKSHSVIINCPTIIEDRHPLNLSAIHCCHLNCMSVTA